MSKRGKKFISMVTFGKIKRPRGDTLDLLNITGAKPHINDFMDSFMAQYEKEKKKEMLKLAKSWRKHNGWPSSMFYDCMGEDDYVADDSDEYGDVYYDGLGNKLTEKQLKKLNKKLYGKNKDKARYSYYDDDEEGYEQAYKSIKFYPDIEDEMTYDEFHSVKEFNDFCDSQGYYVGVVDSSNLANMSVVHCCLDPIDLEYGEKSIITDSSYGGLYWTVSDDVTKKSVQAGKFN